MSDAEDDSSQDSPYLGTEMGQPRQNYQSMMQQATGNYRENASLPMSSLDSEPDRMQLGMYSEYQQPTVWEAVNYPNEQEFQFESFYLRYERQSEARAIIDKPVNDTWQDSPKIHDEEHGEDDEEKSTFEQKAKEFFEGEHTRRQPIHRLNVLDRLARLGRFAILVIGTADGRELSTPLYDDEFDGLDDLNYLATFAEDRVVDINPVGDMTDERYRLPKTFEVVTKEPEFEGDFEQTEQSQRETEEIHWSRVIHVPEGSLETDLYGTPALKPVFHELLNVDKIKAASGEGYWRAGYQGLLIQPPEDPTSGQRMRFSDDGEGVQEEIGTFLNNFKRTIKTRAEVSSLDSTVSNPGPHLQANYQSIAAALDLPKSILTGEDRADTGSATDVRQWHQKIGQRRNTYAEPVIVEPLIQRMIRFGLLPKPDGEGFTIEWPPLDELSETEEADLHSKRATTLKSLAPSGDPTHLASVGELRKVLGWGPEIGSEVNNPDPLEEGELQADEEALNPDDEEEQEAVTEQEPAQDDEDAQPGESEEDTDSSSPDADQLRDALEEAGQG